eukprot:GAHX01000882.1.p1 GENE.GAHX01000882.1~~GAHX01000882.1.p1  ORF type:complete len:247 (-),score=36.63 GAHX01000882.1:118-858(-)
MCSNTTAKKPWCADSFKDPHSIRVDQISSIKHLDNLINSAREVVLCANNKKAIISLEHHRTAGYSNTMTSPAFMKKYTSSIIQDMRFKNILRKKQVKFEYAHTKCNYLRQLKESEQIRSVWMAHRNYEVTNGKSFETDEEYQDNEYNPYSREIISENNEEMAPFPHKLGVPFIPLIPPKGDDLDDISMRVNHLAAMYETYRVEFFNSFASNKQLFDKLLQEVNNLDQDLISMFFKNESYPYRKDTD